MNRYQAPSWARIMYDFTEYITGDFLGGKRCVPMSWAVNFHKLVTLFLIYGMMYAYDNFSIAAWVYLGLHGSYGYCWMIKHFGFRDVHLDKKITLHGSVMLYVCLVGWYWLLPYLFISGHMNPPGEVIFAAIVIHTLGVTMMIAADCQKHFSLKYRKGLITNGVFAYTRNPNFIGEIMIYGAYAMLVNHWVGYLIYAYAIVYWSARMRVKDASISRYQEWDSYAKQSSRLIPWKALMVPFKCLSRSTSEEA